MNFSSAANIGKFNFEYKGIFSPENRLQSSYFRGKKATCYVLGAVLIASTLIFAQPAHETRGANKISNESVLTLTNQSRLQNGLSPLKENNSLDLAARNKALDILKNGYFAHVSPSGEKPWDFIHQTGMTYKYAGENLAINYTSPYELIEDLLQSPSHRDNILSPLFSDIGIAVVEGTYQNQPAVVVVQMFANPANSFALKK